MAGKLNLSDAAIRAAKPACEAFKLTDGRGLHLLVNPSGSGQWRMQYRFAGKQRIISLNIVPRHRCGSVSSLPRKIGYRQNMKALTSHDVISAYRFILNREPESEAVIKAHQNAGSWRELRKILLASDEFQSQQKWKTDDERLQIGRFFDTQCDPTEVDCSDSQEREMYDRIATEWEKFGETEVYHSVLTHGDYRDQQIDDGKREKFFQSGRETIELSLNFLRRSGLKVGRFSRALDFGCGAGRLSIAVSKYADHVVGVDVSRGHLAEARKNVERLKIDNVELVQIKSVDELDSFQGFDLVISIIVLQHNPPPLMAALFRKLLKSLRPGGVAVVQMPTYIHNQRFSVDEYLQNDPISMEMNALPQWKIFEIIADEGCRPLEIREDDSTNMGHGLSHIFALIKENTVS